MSPLASPPYVTIVRFRVEPMKIYRLPPKMPDRVTVIAVLRLRETKIPSLKIDRRKGEGRKEIEFESRVIMTFNSSVELQNSNLRMRHVAVKS